MKKVFGSILVVMFATSSAFAGPISSGGVRGGELLACQSLDRGVQLTVSVVNNDHLEAQLADYSSTQSTSLFISNVHMVGHANGEAYDGDSLSIIVDYGVSEQVATVVVKSSGEPLIYSNLICTTRSSIK